jgi:hypothetical protein
MRNGIFAAVLALLGGSSLAWGQEACVTGLPVTNFDGCACPCPPRIWGSAEYLMWWSKGQSLNTPLVTSTTNFADPQSGGIGRPGTQVLLGPGGGDNLNYPLLSGVRATVGGWIDRGGNIGVEGTGFWLQQATASRTYSSNSAGSPQIGNPINDAFNGGIPNSIASTFPIAPANGFGNITVSSQTQLWGAEANGVLNVLRNQTFTVDLLGGFRYADLTENLGIVSHSTNLTPVAGGGGVNFLNNSFDGTTTNSDLFRTRNQFYGGTVGARAQADLGRFIVNLTGKVSLGTNQESLDIQGNSTLQLKSGGIQTAQGGIYALPSNIGHYTHSNFSVIPEAELKVGYKITPRITAFAGYNFMYWSDVARPGQQVNPNVDIRQVPVAPPGLYAPNANLQPQAQAFHQSGFWTQGVTFGLEFKF